MSIPTFRLDGLCAITMGQAPSGDTYNHDSIGFPLIAGAGDFGKNHPFAKKFTTSPTRLCKEGDIILGIRATIGEKVIADKEYCLGRGVAGLRAGNSLDQRFLWHWLSEARSLLASKARGATFKQVNKEDIAELEIPLPPLPEQRRIAAILDKAEALKTKRRVALEQLDKLSQSIFIEMFGDPVTNPKKWPEAKLGDLILSASDGPHVSPTYAETGVPFLSARHVRPGKISWHDLKYLTQHDAEIQWKKCKPCRGDILYTKGGTTGFAAVVETDDEFAVWVHIALLKPNLQLVDPSWLEAMLNSQYCYHQSQSLTHGIANRDLGLTRMVKILLFSPPLELQREFRKRSQTITDQIRQHKLGLDTLNLLFASIQHRAFRGEL